MPIAPIPFTPSMESGLSAIAGASPAAMNVVIDSKGTVRRRPGIAAYSGAPSAAIDSNPILGLHRTLGGKLFAIAGILPGEVKLYLVTASGSTLLRTNTASSRPSWAETEAMLAYADGRTINRILLPSLEVDRLPGDPPTASHVIAQGSRLLANDVATSLSQVRFSAPQQGASTTGHEQWGSLTTATGTSGFFSAEARPDPVVALGENTNEVFAFGTTNMQIFAPDPKFIYSSIVTRESGCAAAASVIRDDHSFAWLDHNRRFVHGDGRNVEILSDPIQLTIDNMGRVDDCFGFRVLHGPIDAFVWVFAEDGRSFCYQKGGGWSQWMTWAGNNWTRMPINAHTRVVGAADNVVGLTDGKIGLLTPSVQTDLGTAIQAYVLTGFLNRDSDKWKQCVAVRFALRRGAASVEPVASLQWRDDEGSWQSPIQVSLGPSGDQEIVVELRGLGTYRRRQWRFHFLGTEELELAGATEEYEVLMN